MFNDIYLQCFLRSWNIFKKLNFFPCVYVLSAVRWMILCDISILSVNGNLSLLHYGKAITATPLPDVASRVFYVNDLFYANNNMSIWYIIIIFHMSSDIIYIDTQQTIENHYYYYWSQIIKNVVAKI